MAVCNLEPEKDNKIDSVANFGKRLCDGQKMNLGRL
jgi:hypothetical protein